MTEPTSPRVLIPLTIHFAVRYVVRTGLLDQLAEHCRPVLALSWDDPDLAATLATPGIEVVRLPDAEVSPGVHGRLQALEVPFARRLASPSAPIDRRRRHVDRPRSVRLRRAAAFRRDRFRARRPGSEAERAAALAAALPGGTNMAANQAFLTDLGIDAVLSVTPFAIQELVVLHAASRLGLPCATSILSFDNLTTRPPLPVVFDRYVVWNRYNADEVLRAYPTVRSDQVTVAGPAQFDFYRDPSYLEDRSTWRARVGLGDHERTVLYGAGPPSVCPHEDQYVEDLLAAVDDGRLPADLRLVLRRHPNDRPDRWTRFHAHPAVRVDDPGALGTDERRPGQTDLGREQIVGLCSSLAHTDVHVSVSSTMTLDGAAFDKPQIGPAYDRRGGRRHRRRARELYAREHFVPIVASGGLALASSPAELVALVADGLAHPEHKRAERLAMLTAICTVTDGSATERVAAALALFLDAVRDAPPT